MQLIMWKKHLKKTPCFFWPQFPLKKNMISLYQSWKMTVWAINFSKVLCILHPRWFICETWWNTGMGLIEQWFFLLPQVVWAVGIILRTCPNMWIVIYYNKPIEKPYKPASVNKILFHCSICDTPKHWRIVREGNIFQQVIDDVFSYPSKKPLFFV